MRLDQLPNGRGVVLLSQWWLGQHKDLKVWLLPDPCHSLCAELHHKIWVPQHQETCQVGCLADGCFFPLRYKNRVCNNNNYAYEAHSSNLRSVAKNKHILSIFYLTILTISDLPEGQAASQPAVGDTSLPSLVCPQGPRLCHSFHWPWPRLSQAQSSFWWLQLMGNFWGSGQPNPRSFSPKGEDVTSLKKTHTHTHLKCTAAWFSLKTRCMKQLVFPCQVAFSTSSLATCFALSMVIISGRASLSISAKSSTANVCRPKRMLTSSSAKKPPMISQSTPLKAQIH